MEYMLVEFVANVKKTEGSLSFLRLPDLPNAYHPKEDSFQEIYGFIDPEKGVIELLGKV